MSSVQHLARAVISVPPLLAGESNTEGGLPERLDAISRFNACQLMRILGAPVLLEPADSGARELLARHGGRGELGQLLVLVEAEDAQRAMGRAGPVIEAVVDALSFQMQEPIHIISFEVLTADPDAEGNVGATMYGAPESFLSARFSPNSMNFQWSFRAATRPDLGLANRVHSDRVRGALHWYIKALDAPYLADQFIAFWIALETLEPGRRRLHDTDPKPYHAPCGHQLTECPECGASIMRPTSGDRMKQCLQLDGLMTADQANEAWKVRQMMHGQGGFSPQQVETLGRVTPSLRAAVLCVLRAEMGLGDQELPLAQSAGGPILGRVLTLMGTQKLSPDLATRITMLKAL